VAVSTWHLVSLEAHFHRQKAASKPLKDAFYATFGCAIKKLPWSDPAPAWGERTQLAAWWVGAAYNLVRMAKLAT